MATEQSDCQAPEKENDGKIRKLLTVFLIEPRVNRPRAQPPSHSAIPPSVGIIFRGSLGGQQQNLILNFKMSTRKYVPSKYVFAYISHFGAQKMHTAGIYTHVFKLKMNMI